MPAMTYLADYEVRMWASVPEDKDVDDLLQQLRKASGENWLIGRHNVQTRHASWWRRVFCKIPEPLIEWTLYADCHGEWQVMNLVTPGGGSNFHRSKQSREDVMNYMLGYIGGLHRNSRGQNTRTAP